jgi:hypothetical protein
VLDPDRAVVQADRVAAAPAQPDQLVDRAVAIDQEVRADARPLAELDVGRIRGERVERRAEAARRGVVLHDHLRIDEPGLRLAVVAPRVAPHLGPTVGPEGDRVPLDRGLGRGGRRRHGTDGVHGARVASHRPAREPAGGQLDDESDRAGRAVVLPARGGAAVGRQAPDRQADATGVGPHRPVAGAARQDHEAQLLVVVDREVGLDVRDQPPQRARLRLARAGAAREVGVERPPAAGPAEREVAVEVDAARVVARAAAYAVGVRGPDEPQLHARRRLAPPQPGDHRVARGLVAVDRADDEHAHRRRRVADANDPQRASFGGLAERLGAGARRARGRRVPAGGHPQRDQQCEQKFAHDSASC